MSGRNDGQEIGNADKLGQFLCNSCERKSRPTMKPNRWFCSFPVLWTGNVRHMDRRIDALEKTFDVIALNETSRIITHWTVRYNGQHGYGIFFGKQFIRSIIRKFI